MIFKKEYLTEIIKQRFPDLFGDSKSLLLEPISGGSINDCYRLSIGLSTYFLKFNKQPDLLQKEQEGLDFLIGKSPLVIPRVLGFINGEEGGFLLMEYLERKPETGEFFEALGEGLAFLHLNFGNQFGFHSSNFIGKLNQTNTFCDSWQEFYFLNRIEPLMRSLKDKKCLNIKTERSLNAFSKRISEIFPTEKPSALHGDLWSGNKLNCSLGPAIFDPSVYYGHREMDLGMSLLFGGFTSEFYRSYNHQFPLEKAWEKRTAFTQIYPLLVHAEMFGPSYLLDVESSLKAFQ